LDPQVGENPNGDFLIMDKIDELKISDLQELSRNNAEIMVTNKINELVDAVNSLLTGISTNLCKCGNPKDPLHHCPFKAVVDHDDVTLCNCCVDCTDDCNRRI